MAPLYTAGRRRGPAAGRRAGQAAVRARRPRPTARSPTAGTCGSATRTPIRARTSRPRRPGERRHLDLAGHGRRRRSWRRARRRAPRPRPGRARHRRGRHRRRRRVPRPGGRARRPGRPAGHPRARPDRAAGRAPAWARTSPRSSRSRSGWRPSTRWCARSSSTASRCTPRAAPTRRSWASRWRRASPTCGRSPTPGWTSTTAARLLEFRYAATAEQFPTIAKLRAARRLWARVLEACGARRRGRPAPARRHLADDDHPPRPLREPAARHDRRASPQASAARTRSPCARSTPRWARPRPFSRRVARNTQALLVEEAHLARVVDPAGGSWYVESLTDALARAALGVLPGDRGGGRRRRRARLRAGRGARRGRAGGPGEGGGHPAHADHRRERVPRPRREARGAGARARPPPNGGLPRLPARGAVRGLPRPLRRRARGHRRPPDGVPGHARAARRPTAPAPRSPATCWPRAASTRSRRARPRPAEAVAAAWEQSEGAGRGALFQRRALRRTRGGHGGGAAGGRGAAHPGRGPGRRARHRRAALRGLRRARRDRRRLRGWRLGMTIPDFTGIDLGATGAPGRATWGPGPARVGRAGGHRRQAALHRRRPARRRLPRHLPGHRALPARPVPDDVRHPAVDHPPVRRVLHGHGVERVLPAQPRRGPEGPLDRVRPGHPPRLRLRPPAGRRRRRHGGRRDRLDLRHAAAVRRHPAGRACRCR